MAQFELYRLDSGVLVVDLQTDLIGIDVSLVVAPLREAGRHVALTPLVEIDGTNRIVRVQELAAVPAAELRTRAGTLAQHRDALKRALDILIDGVRPGGRAVREGNSCLDGWGRGADASETTNRQNDRGTATWRCLRDCSALSGI